MEPAMKRAWLPLMVALLLQFSANAQRSTCTISLDAATQESQIDRNIYGQFAEHLGRLVYGGIWVGPNSPIPNVDGIRKDVLDALKELKVPVLRWPGGCFADEYHWQDGIGPRAERPKMINTNWGGVTEDNSFGTHEFLKLCSLIGCEPYITGNVGSGTVKELSQWVEYINSDNVSPMTELRKKNGQEKAWGVKYWGVGNENWGCGGQMLPEYYADQVRRYGMYMRTYGENRVYRIACGPNADNYVWTNVLMKNAASSFDGLSLHYYSSAGKKIATDIGERDWFDIMKKTVRMEELITKHSAIMDQYDPLKRIALIVDEWGTWYKVEPGTNSGFLYQQNTIRDAVAAATNLNIFNNHCDRVKMANIAQVVNVLQAMILTDGSKMILTPTYHVFNLFKVHQDAMMVPAKLASPGYVFGRDTLEAVNCSASVDNSGTLHVSLCNIDPNAGQEVAIDLNHYTARTVSGRLLAAGTMNAHNSFENPDAVKPAEFSGFTLAGGRLKVKMPPMAVVLLTIDGKVKLDQPRIVLDTPKSGLNYKYYEISGETMPLFATLTPVSGGMIEMFEVPKNARERNFGVHYDGYIKIAQEGLYTFFTTSDDGSAIKIDGRLIVNNDGRHAAIERSGFVQLSPGFHQIELMFFQAGGDVELSASMQGPTMEKQVIPASMLFRK
jgi:alpha-L-arabinofuranosidase